MKKRLIATVLALSLTASLCLTSCGGAPSQEAQAPGEAPVSAGTPDGATPKLKVGMIAGLTGLGDKSMNDQALLACQMAEKDFGIEYKVLEPKDSTQVLDMMQSLIEQKYDLIIAAVSDYDTVIAELAPTAKDTNFISIDSELEAENIMCVEYLTHLGSYVAGAAAAMKSESGILGCVGGMDLPVINRFIVGFEEGAKSVNPDAKIISKYVGATYEAWADSTTAKSITLDMVNSGADVVYQIAGGAGLGVIDGCKESGVWAIGVNVDQEEIAPETVLTSMLTKGEVAAYDAIKKAINGETISGRYQATLENGGVGIVYSKHFTEDEIAKLKQIEQDIISGKITVTDVLAQAQ